MKTICWFQNDLRLSDQAALHWITENSFPFSGVVFEPSNSSIFQGAFFWQSVESVRKKLSSHSVELYVLRGKPTEVLPRLVELNSIDLVVKNGAYNFLESQEEESLARLGIPLKIFQDRTLLQVDALPFNISELPDVFTNFRKKVEENLNIPEPKPAPQNFVGFSLKVDSEINSVNPFSDIKLPFLFFGSEEVGLQRIADFFFNTKAVLNYKNTRNGMIEKNDSSKFSPWLATGALSPRLIYRELLRFEEEVEKNESTYWILFELLWRDYFKLLARKIGPKLFDRSGIRKAGRLWTHDKNQFENWRTGNTDSAFVNAIMCELLKTGWTSNRGRQNAASYLAKTLEIDWTWGASWFEQQLIDFDRESNWGNWLYLSGAGTDPRNRVFDPDRQAMLYDPNYAYQNLWLK